MAHEQGVASSTRHHAHGGDPSFTYTGRRESPIANGEHMRHGFE